MAQKLAIPEIPLWWQSILELKPPVVGIRQGDSLGSGALIQMDQCPLALLTNKHVVPLQGPIELILDGRRLHGLVLAPAAEVFPAEVDAEWLVLTAEPTPTPPKGPAMAAALAPLEALRQRAFRSNQLAAMPPLYAGAPIPVRSFGYRVVELETIDFKQPPGPTKAKVSERLGNSVGVMSPALREGYDLVMDAAVEQGMSGGPILSLAGQLIGINGVHARPAWGAPATLRNGSEANPRLADLLERSSLGLSVNQLLPAIRRWQQTCNAPPAAPLTP